MNLDRQTILQALIEGALRAAADPAVTAVLRSWDFYAPGDTVQPLMPLLVVGVTDDRPVAIDVPFYTASCSVTIVGDWGESVRDTYDRVRESVRASMQALPGLSAYGLTVDGVREISCTEPDFIDTDGDAVLAQILSFTLWFTAPVTAPAVLDQVPYLVERDPETGATYLTAQAEDPRRIERWLPSGTVTQVSYGYGAWADRAALVYSSPVTPLATHLPSAAADINPTTP